MSTFSNLRRPLRPLAAVGVLALAACGISCSHRPSPVMIDVTGDQAYSGVTLQIAANGAAAKTLSQVTFSATQVLEVGVDLPDSVSGTVLFAANAYDANQCLIGTGQASLSGVKSGAADGQIVSLLVSQNQPSGCAADAGPDDGAGAAGSGGMDGSGGMNGDGGSNGAGGAVGTGGTTTGSCAGVTCNSPPATQCTDANTLTSYGSAGTCSNGNCSYPTTALKCSSGCANAACKPDACIGVTCSSPPADQCRSATQFQAYDKIGSCSAGTCSYTGQLISCTCQTNACTTDPCVGIPCATPPAASCSNANTLVTYASKGTCSGGGCSYTATTSTCTLGCANGACNTGAGTGGRTGATGTGGRTGAGGATGSGGSATGTGGSNGTGPCAAYCSGPTSFTSPFNSGNLTTSARCFQTTTAFTGGNCSNFTGRTLSVNGVAESCGSNWPALPAAVMGGYCIQVSAGGLDYAAFTTF